MLPIHAQIKSLRKRARLTQAAFARRIGVSQQQVAKAEAPRANLRLSTLEKIADGLDANLVIELTARPQRR